MSFVGLFAVCTMLFMEMSNTGLATLDAGSPVAKSRTTAWTAGAIMTATANALIMMVVGCDVMCGCAAPAAAPPADAAEAAKAAAETA
jgi:hypothetical protein